MLKIINWMGRMTLSTPITQCDTTQHLHLLAGIIQSVLSSKRVELRNDVAPGGASHDRKNVHVFQCWWSHVF